MSLRPLCVIASLFLAAAASAQSTAFTFQALLKDGAEPASGLHDFRFALFDAASGGAQVGAVQCVDNILLSDGIVTATVDFGQQYATTSPRFLQVEVRADTGLTCANLAGFIILGQRQTITAAPVASHARSAGTAFSLSAPDGSPANAVFVDNSGNVGIGTTAPAMPLHIRADDPILILQDFGATSTQSGYLTFWNSSNVETAWMGYGSPGSPHFSVVNARSGGHIALLPFSGNVGIGTSAPLAKLDVRGDIRLGTSGQLRATAGVEKLRIIRGQVFSNGAIGQGTGFTAARLGTGKYRVTFSTPFSDDPTGVAMVATVTGEATKFVQRGPAFDTASFLFEVIQRSDGSYADGSFYFIIMGLD
jgi:hypothetical protein